MRYTQGMSASIRKAILDRFKEFPRIADRGVKHIALQEGVSVEDVYGELDVLEREQIALFSNSSVGGGGGWTLNPSPPAEPPAEVKAPKVKIKPGAKKANRTPVAAKPIEAATPVINSEGPYAPLAASVSVLPAPAPEPAPEPPTRRMTLSELAVEIPASVLEKLAATKRLAVAYEKHSEFSGPLDAMFIEAALEFEAAATKVLGSDTIEAKPVKALPVAVARPPEEPRPLVVTQGPSFCATVKNVFVDNPGVIYLKDLELALRGHQSLKSLAPTLSGLVRDGYLARVGTGAYTRQL